jgi:hypothetical protein
MNEYCNTDTSWESNYASYPVTPPEQWTLGFCEFCNMLVFKTGKNYTNALGGEQRQRTQQRTTTNNKFV